MHLSSPVELSLLRTPRFQAAVTEAAAVDAYFKERGLESVHGTFDDIGLRKRVKDGEFDLLVAVGGDGTMLRASSPVRPIWAAHPGCQYRAAGIPDPDWAEGMANSL